MEASTITALATGGRHLSFRTAAAEIQQLESQLGLPPGAAIFNLKTANARVRELRGLMASLPVAAAAAPAAQAHSITFSELKAIHSLTFGETQTASRLANDSDHDFGRKEYVAAKQKLEAARNANPSVLGIRARENAMLEFSKFTKGLEARRAGSEDDQRFRLTADFAAAGVSVRGLSFAGHAIPEPGSAAIFSPPRRAAAQRDVARFLAGIRMEDIGVLSEFGAVAESARKFLRAAGKLDGKNRITI